MFLRFTSRTNADGAVVRYVALAHNRRVDGQIKPDVLMNLGREDQVDVAGLQRLAASIGRHFGGDEPAGAAPAGAAARAASLEVIDVRTIGATWLLDALWRRLDVGAAVRAATGARRFTAGLERALFALVAHRAVAPMSGLPAAEWVREEAAVPGLSTMDDEHVRRAMDLLVGADTQARVQESLSLAGTDRLDPLFFDTIQFACDDGEQIVIGLAVTKEGIPVRCWCWPGGAGDDAVPAEVRDDLLDRHPGRVITVVERAFSGADDLAGLRRAGEHYIAGMRMSDGNRLVAAVLSRPGRYRHVRDDLRVREVRLDGQDARFVVCHDLDQAQHDRRERDEAIVHLQTELTRIADQHARDEAARVRAECTLRAHPTLGRWLIRLPDGRLKVDLAKARAEARLDGKHLIATSDPHISAEDVALGYKNLLEARDLKAWLLPGAAARRSGQRIRAHVLIWWLALLLIRVAEHSSGQPWRTINRQLGRVAQVTLTGPAGTVTQTTPLGPEQAAIYRALTIQPPARVTASAPGRRGARGRSR
ncbi:hypothetical protein ACFO1B_08610 [Dactylosporangium siamense]|uniref:IS1634 family transposase n=1 Tax=Dactylosporangium siamense TaxID=685454 RepID=A0A919UDI7_9ACTN|nr:hypothetical protein [Dactylosporangium siamense]GIG47951.1 hypothetical protein Dsi01nite_059920 [Dactylosporangium siamense]